MLSIMRSTILRLIVLALVIAASACGGDQAAQGAAPAGGGMPPTAVKVLTLEQKPVEQTSEFIATVRSLRSTTIQPEVEGIVTRILVKSGQRVGVGTPLIQINAEKQQATVRSTEANRAGAEAEVQYWRQQAKRLEALVEAGAISRQEFDQAHTSLRNAEARLTALEAQVREQQVELRYYRVNAPQAGVVGDIPIREGDRVTKSTVLTTIDANEALEAYIEVPIERAPELRVGLRVQLLDVDGKVAATNPITFVAPRVEPGTQSVLAKVALKDTPERMRTHQFIKARIIWQTAPGLMVPVVAVTRISGQYFCFVAEPQGQGFVARQRPLKVGTVIADDYVVVSGLKPGEKVIVSGIQKIGDGAPVRPEDEKSQKPGAGS
jgi:RND family efflux transporter MFP subunit